MKIWFFLWILRFGFIWGEFQAVFSFLRTWTMAKGDGRKTQTEEIEKFLTFLSFSRTIHFETFEFIFLHAENYYFCSKCKIFAQHFACSRLIFLQ
jgi:hypothetical protein